MSYSIIPSKRDRSVIIGFFSHPNVETRLSLRHDGTESGTRLVKQIYAGDFTASVTWFKTKLIALNNEVYFTVYDQGNGSLWKTDGTDAGTMVVKEGVKAKEGIVFKTVSISENRDQGYGVRTGRLKGLMYLPSLRE